MASVGTRTDKRSSRCFSLDRGYRSAGIALGTKRFAQMVHCKRETHLDPSRLEEQRPSNWWAVTIESLM